MKPYKAIQTPPITGVGIEASNVENGKKKLSTIAMNAVAQIVLMEALPEIATQPTDSPYVVLHAPPKKAPAIEPTPSPRSVLCKPGSSSKSRPMMELKFLWSAMCSAKTTKATGI